MHDKRFRVAEVFGPTIQGEGRHIGTPCYFIRFAGCDYRCRWCDSPHAVLTEYVNEVPRISAMETWGKLKALPRGPRWVVFSGGNPALFDLKDLCALILGDGYNLMVETQGTVYNDWLRSADEICVSPKPPSSGNMTTEGVLREFLRELWGSSLGNPLNQTYLKVVVFDNEDYAYARSIHKTFENLQMFISVGNEDPSLPTVGNPNPKPGTLPLTRDIVLDKMRWLMEKVANDVTMRNVRVTPQMHVLAWGNERGR